MLESLLVILWNLNANQNSSVISPVVTVMKKTNIPVGRKTI
jgi:hypothetical protein